MPRHGRPRRAGGSPAGGAVAPSGVPARRGLPLALAALLATALATGCGPGAPQPPSTGPSGPTGGSGGGGSGGGGSGGSGGSGTSGGGGGTPSGGGDGGGSAPSIGTAFVVQLVGPGDGWTRDVAAAPGGTVVALTVVGPRGDGGFDRLGLAPISGGQARGGRLYDLGAPVRFPAEGALSTGPGGEIYVALEAQCGPSDCKGLGSRIQGSALVQFSSSGDPAWTAPLPGDVASQPVVDPPGNVAVATSESGTNVVRSFAPSGAQRWQVTLPGGAAGDVALAADAGANVIAARSGDVTKISPGGAILWSRAVGAQVTGVAGTSSGVVVLAGTAPGGAVVIELQPDGSDGQTVPIPGPGDGVRVEVGQGHRIGVVTGSGGCGATVTALDVGGGVLWSRPIATSGCDGSELQVNGVTVTTTGVVVAGAALNGTVDLGGGSVASSGTDGLVVGFGP
jgi:hypothetical protein